MLEAGGAVAAFIQGEISSDEFLDPTKLKNGVAFIALTTGSTDRTGSHGWHRARQASENQVMHWGWGRKYAVVIGEPIVVTKIENAISKDRRNLSLRVMDAINARIKQATEILTA